MNEWIGVGFLLHFAALLVIQLLTHPELPPGGAVTEEFDLLALAAKCDLFPTPPGAVADPAFPSMFPKKPGANDNAAPP